MVNNSHLHRERLRAWITGVCLVTCVLATAAALRPENGQMLWSLTGIVGLAAGSVLFASYLKARRRDHGLNALLADPWVHWRYPQDQWLSLIHISKEKERLESELAIAREVQDQLFPKDVPFTKTLELKGVCHPARMVSGDYYDFMALPHDSLALSLIHI